MTANFGKSNAAEPMETTIPSKETLPAASVTVNVGTFESLPSSLQEELCASSSQWIVNRGGVFHNTPSREERNQAPILRIDRAHDDPTPLPNFYSVVSKSHQLRNSVRAIRESVRKLEQKVKDGIFDRQRLVQNRSSQFHHDRNHKDQVPSTSRRSPTPFPPLKSPHSFHPESEGTPRVGQGPRRPASLEQPPSNASRIRTSLDRWTSKLPSEGSRNEAASPAIQGSQKVLDESFASASDQGALRPRIWRRWTRLDRAMENHSSRWQALAARKGVVLTFSFDAPTGQEIWTDVDIVLHIIDQFVVSLLANGNHGNRIAIAAASHPEDDRWIQVSVRGSFANATAMLIEKPIASASLGVARKFASMLGGFIDQFSGTGNGICWRVHFPADDMLNWLLRAQGAEHQHVTEIEFVGGPDIANEKGWNLVHRAFQAAMDPRDRCILMVRHRYLLTSVDAHLDVGSLRRRFCLQLERLGAPMLEPSTKSTDLRFQPVGQLDAVVQGVLKRLKSESHWSNDAASSRRSSTIPSSAAHVHGSHQLPSAPAAARIVSTKERTNTANTRERRS